jgi:hypothetical protein
MSADFVLVVRFQKFSNGNVGSDEEVPLPGSTFSALFCPNCVVFFLCKNCFGV